MRLMHEYSPMDFGVDREFSLMSEAAQLNQQRREESTIYANPKLVSINKDSFLKSGNQQRKSALLETVESGAQKSNDFQRLRDDVINQTMAEQVEPNTSLFGANSMDESGIYTREDRKITIVAERVDISLSSQVTEQNTAVPFQHTIEHMRELLTKKSAPMQKIIALNQNRQVMTDEIYAYQQRRRLVNKIAGQD